MDLIQTFQFISLVSKNRLTTIYLFLLFNYLPNKSQLLYQEEIVFGGKNSSHKSYRIHIILCYIPLRLKKYLIMNWKLTRKKLKLIGNQILDDMMEQYTVMS